MELSQSSQRMHPLVAGAAASVMLVCLLGAAAITGVLPTSHGTVPSASPAPVAAALVPAAPIPVAPVAAATAPMAEQAVAPAVAQTAPAPRVAAPVVHHHYHTTTVRTKPATTYAQADVPRQAPVYTQPAPAPAPVQTAQNSPVGIGVGAVVGGLLGNQVGGGNGRTLATIAGAVGGGYLGNEIAKRTP